MSKLTNQPFFNIFCVLASVLGILFGISLYNSVTTMLHIILLNIGLLFFYLCVSIWNSKSRDLIFAYGVTLINFSIAHFLLSANLCSYIFVHWATLNHGVSIFAIVLGLISSIYFSFTGFLAFKKINVCS